MSCHEVGLGPKLLLDLLDLSVEPHENVQTHFGSCRHGRHACTHHRDLFDTYSSSSITKAKYSQKTSNTI